MRLAEAPEGRPGRGGGTTRCADAAERRRPRSPARPVALGSTVRRTGRHTLRPSDDLTANVRSESLRRPPQRQGSVGAAPPVAIGRRAADLHPYAGPGRRRRRGVRAVALASLVLLASPACGAAGPANADTLRAAEMCRAKIEGSVRAHGPAAVEGLRYLYEHRGHSELIVEASWIEHDERPNRLFSYRCATVWDANSWTVDRFESESTALSP